MSVLNFISGAGSVAYTSVFASDINTNFLSIRNISCNTLTCNNIGGSSNGLFVRGPSAIISGDTVKLSATNIFLIGPTATISTDNYKIRDAVIQLNSGNPAVSGGLILMNGSLLEYGRIQAVTSGLSYGMEFTGVMSTNVISATYTQATNVAVLSATFNTVSCASASICDLSIVSGGVRISNGIVGFHTGSSVPGVTMRLSDDLLYVSCVSMPVVLNRLSTRNFEADFLVLSSANYSTLTNQDLGYTVDSTTITYNVSIARTAYLSSFLVGFNVPAGTYLVNLNARARTSLTNSGATGSLIGLTNLSTIDPETLGIGKYCRHVHFCAGAGVGTETQNSASYVSTFLVDTFVYLRQKIWTEAAPNVTTFSALATLTRIA